MLDDRIRSSLRLFAVGVVVLSLNAAGAAAQLSVVSTTPGANATAPPTVTISVTFDRATDPASFTASTFRVFGRQSGTAGGAFSFADGNATVIFTPDAAFSAGEIVLVNLSRDLLAQDATPLRNEGYFVQFMIGVVPSSRQFKEIDVMSNRTDGNQTRIYGAAATDLNGDRFADLATVNEVSADVRVFLNRADGTGLFHDFLTPQPIGVEASPNEVADFDGDGNTDLCVAAAITDDVWVLLGAGDGTFSSAQSIPVGNAPHGITVLDVDGDADLDIINANVLSNDMSLMLNDGTGTFGAATFFDAGVNGEYGVASGDLDLDGITDVVVAARDGQQLVTLFGNGDGTFTLGTPQPSGGTTWVVVLGDVNGDGHLDASVANSTSNNGAILIGNGDGTFGTPQLMVTGAHTVSTDIGDLDGDGDLDWVLSSFGGGFWRIYENDGTGAFTFDAEITALNNPSCSIIYDADNDGDLDLALTDEIADVIMLMENTGAVSVTETGPAGPLRVRPAVPNPTGGATFVRVELEGATDVTVVVYDARGRRVASRSYPGLSAGPHDLRLDGTDVSGRALPAGVYAFEVVAGAARRTGRVVLAR